MVLGASGFRVLRVARAEVEVEYICHCKPFAFLRATEVEQVTKCREFACGILRQDFLYKER